MYENITFDVIMQRMLDRVSDKLDKRESSVIYSALAPAAVELQLMYMEFDIILKETFGDTASREYLIRRAAERGIIPYPATHAIIKGEFTPVSLNIPAGTRFNLNELNYKVVAKITSGEYKLECEETGIMANQNLGDLIPIDYINGLETAKLTEVLIPGEDEEDTEDIRQRYLDSFKSKPYGGNKADYIQKAGAVEGVGSVKVTPAWNGGGTVKLTILDSDYNKASDTLIASVQDEIDPDQDGKGAGVAPIGHVVTVDTATEVTVNVAATITYDTDYSFTVLKSTIEEAIEAYLLELRKSWAEQGYIIVRKARIETDLLKIKGILDISGITINGSSDSLTLAANQIPVMGSVTG